jgi:tetratricopeptide (TPR) repeat protein
MAAVIGTFAATMVGGVLELPARLSLLERVERVARELGQIDVVVLSYGRALTGQPLQARLAAAVGSRLAGLEGESSVEASFFVEALTKVLELVPGARWALDRVKLTLVLQARWDDFFRLYDRALDATKSEGQRAELLREVAFAARDVANDMVRAERYLNALCELRPDDESACAARRRVQRQAATLRLDLGDAQGASTTVDAMLEGGADVADVSDLLERLARHPGQGRAVERLLGYYESVGRIDDCIRMADAALDLDADPTLLNGLARALARLRVSAAGGAPGAFARAAAHIESDVAKRPALAATVYRSVLRLAIAASKRAPTDADFVDAADAAWRALDTLTRLRLEAGDVRGACRLLYRGSRLPFERPRRRELLRRAVELRSDVLGDAPATIRLLDEIFRDDAADPVALGLVDRFASLLRDAGQEDRVARLWEGQADHRPPGGNEPTQGTCWRLAAEAWERHGSIERAIAAYGRGSALGSEESFEALARIHAARAEWPEAAAALEWLQSHSRAPGRDRRALRLARAYAELDRSDRARTCLEEVLCSAQEIEDAEAVRTQLVALYRRDCAWRPLVDMLSTLAQATEDREQRVALFHEASAIARSKLDAPAEAADLLDLAVASDPGDVGIRLELAEVLEGLEQWSRAAQVLQDRIALFGDQRPKERALLHHRLARALSRANDPAGALAQLRLASRMLPTHPAILHDLGRAAADTGDLDLAEQTYRALLLGLRHPSEPSSTVSSAAVLLALGSVARRKGNEARAADLAESALESALDAGEDPRPFESVLRDMGRNDLLARTLMRHAERASDVAARAVALRELVDVWKSHLGREADLGARLRRCARIVGDDLEREQTADGDAWAALWSVHDSLGDEASLLDRGNRLAPVLKGAIDRMDPGAGRARLRVALARMLAAQPAHADEAVALLSTALDETTTDGEVADLPGYLDAAWRVSDALERAGDAKGAARLYESILDRRPADIETARGLAERLEAIGSERLADAIELCIALDAKAGRGLADRLVSLRDARGDVAGVVRGLEAIFETDPGNGSAPEDRPLLRRLVDAYEALGADEKILGLLDRALAIRPHDGELACLRAGARDRTGDVDGAVSDLLAVGVDDERHLRTALSMLERIVSHSAPAAAGDYSLALVDLLIRAGRPEEAGRELEALLARDPSHVGGLERMASLAAVAEAWDKAAEIYGRLVRACSEQPGKADTAFLARVVSGLAHAYERTGRPQDARRPLEAAQQLLPGNPDVDRALEHVYELTGDWNHLAARLEARAERASEVGDKAALLLRAATILVEHAGQPSSGLSLIERARSIAPESVEATLAWARLRTAAGRPREALDALQEVARRSRGKRSPALADVYLEIGKAHLADDELVEALEALKAGFAIEWQRGELAILVGLVALDLGEEQTAERALLAVAMAAPRKEGSRAGAVPADKVVAFYHLASLAHAKGDREKARRWVTKAVADDPAHAEARALLERLEEFDARATKSRGTSR